MPCSGQFSSDFAPFGDFFRCIKSALIPRMCTDVYQARPSVDRRLGFLRRFFFRGFAIDPVFMNILAIASVRGGGGMCLAN